jgi:hypothetical protein
MLVPQWALHYSAFLRYTAACRPYPTQYNSRMATQDDIYLYHYTTVDALVNIVEKQQLWATNILYLNDAAEYHLAVDQAKGILKAEIEHESDVTLRARLEAVAKSLEEQRLGAIMDPSCFACCFSGEEDDLNQWRCYCRNGGVAIGFRRDDLQDIANNQGLGLAPQLVRCIYEENEQREVIRKCVTQAVEEVPGGTFGASMSPEEVDKYRAGLLLCILGGQPIKHKDFSTEKEWRFIARPDPGMAQDERLGLRSRNGLVVPYWIIDLDPYQEKDKRIWRNVRVTVGPNPHPNELKASIECLLNRYCKRPANPDLTSRQVKNSRVTYRYW